MAATKVSIAMTSSLDPVLTDDLSQPLLNTSSELTSVIRSTKEELTSIASDKSDAASTTIHVKSDLTSTLVFNPKKCAATQETATFACMSKLGCWEELIDANAGKNNAMSGVSQSHVPTLKNVDSCS
jgi:hypothetical protein